MNIVILTEKGFPYGSAAVNRIISYAKGLSELSNNVQVICLKPSEKKGTEFKNKYPEGEFNSIKFKYITGSTVKSDFFLTRALNYIKGIRLTFVYLWKIKPDVLFMGLFDPFTTFLFYAETRILKIRFVQERSEYPFLGTGKNLFTRVNYWIYIHLIIKLFDGLVVITESLKQFFTEKINKKAKITILPMLAEPDRFNIPRDTKKTNDYIAFCGELSGNKDGVPILIESFSLIAQNHPSCKLVLIGNTNFKEFNKLVLLVEKLNLYEKVVFTGQVSRDEIPELLCQAKVLVLARPESKQAEGGFPTKLGEYLATGNPVVVTKVGEIPNYLTHLQNAYLAEPGDASDFAEKLDDALANYDKAQLIGKNGQKLVYNEFNYKTQSVKLDTFLRSL